MTTRKLKAVERICWVSDYPIAFKSVLDAVSESLGPVLDTMSAAQIAAVIEFGYSQHNKGVYAGFLDYR